MSAEDNELESKWSILLDRQQRIVGRRPADLNAVLFLIGVQELGQGIKQFSKEQKQDLMHIATCKLLSYSGIYEFEGVDEQGWPHWKLVKNLPFLNLLEQEKLLKSLAIDYFESEV